MLPRVSINQEGFCSDKCTGLARIRLLASVGSRITAVILLGIEHVNYICCNEPFAVSLYINSTYTCMAKSLKETYQFSQDQPDYSQIFTVKWSVRFVIVDSVFRHRPFRQCFSPKHPKRKSFDSFSLFSSIVNISYISWKCKNFFFFLSRHFPWEFCTDCGGFKSTARRIIK